MAKFSVALPELGDQPLDRDRSQWIEMLAVKVAEERVEQVLQSLEGETDITIPAVAVEDPITLLANLSNEEIARQLGEAMARAIEAALPHSRLAPSLPSTVRALLGPLVPRQGGTKPTDDDFFAIGWELAEADAKALANYLSATGNPTPLNRVTVANGRAKSELERITDIYSSDKSGSFERDATRLFTGCLYSAYKKTSEDEAQESFGRMCGAMLAGPFGVSPYARFRMKESTELFTWMRNLLGSRASQLEQDVFGSLPNYDSSKIPSRRSLPTVSWAPVRSQGQIDGIATQVSAMADTGNRAGAQAYLNGLSDLDRARAVLAWRRLNQHRWTSYEIDQQVKSADPIVGRGWVPNGTILYVTPNAAGPQKGTFGTADGKMRSVGVVNKVNGYWQIIPDKNKETEFAFIQDDKLRPVGSHQPLAGEIFAPNKMPSPEDVQQGSAGTCYFLAALMSIARTNPQFIKDMIRDNGDGTISVRFYKQSGADMLEDWVKVDRTVLSTKKTRKKLIGQEQYDAPAYAATSTGELWVSLLEKAYGAWKGKGTYHAIEGGWANEVFKEVLGGAANQFPMKDSVGFAHEQSAATLASVKDLPAADAQALVTFGATQAWQDEKKDLSNRRPGARRDWAVHEEYLRRAGVSKEGIKALEVWYQPHVEGKLGSGRYTGEAIAVFEMIRTAVSNGQNVVLDTKYWGKGDGHSGGENTDKVHGLAAPHAYTVMGAPYQDEKGFRWIPVRNPWGHTGREVAVRNKVQVFLGMDPLKVKGKQDDASFTVELSELMKYFGNVHVA